MIQFRKGNILTSQTEALVNTVNTVGVMGKGVALTIKNKFPQTYLDYKAAIDEKRIDIGKLLVSQTDGLYPKYIIHFPTKKHWRHPSKIDYIKKGLEDLIRIIRENNIKSIALPPLGCGNGKLEWDEVKPLITSYLQEVSNNCEIVVFEPGFIEEQILNEKKSGKLTPARAMLLQLMKSYTVLHYDINLLVAQKLAYFLQRIGEPLKLKFEKGPYGPYAHNLNHVLRELNDSFLFFDEAQNKKDTPIRLNADVFEKVDSFSNEKLSDLQKAHLHKVLNLIEGLESPYGLELLATVDFILNQNKDCSAEEIYENIQNWTERKKELMKVHHIKVAFGRLQEFKSDLYN